MTEEDLEQKKLRLEIQKLSRPWCFQPEYLSIAVPVLLGTLAFLAAFLSGFFDREREALREEKASLEKQIGSLRLGLEKERANVNKAKEQLGISQREWAAIAKVVAFPSPIIMTDVVLGGGGVGVTIEANTDEGFYFRAGIKPGVMADPRVSELLDTLCDIQRLEHLTVRKVALTKEDIRRIARLKIRKLTLSENGLADEMVDPLGRMTNLRSLSLEGNKNIHHPKALGELTDLTFLDLERTSFDDEGMALLRPFANSLVHLLLANTNVSDDGLRHLSGFVNLERLHLSGCPNVTRKSLVELAELPKLTWLTLESCGIPKDELQDILDSLLEQNETLRIRYIRSDLGLLAVPVGPVAEPVSPD